MSDQAQDVVALAAVGGQRIDHELLEAVAEHVRRRARGRPAGGDRRRGAADRRERYVFRHALLREVVHEDLLPGQHARLHARFAAVLEAARAGRPGGRRRWRSRTTTAPRTRLPRRSAGRSRRRRSRAAAFHESLKMYERALELWDQVERAGGDRRAPRDGVGEGGAGRLGRRGERACAGARQRGAGGAPRRIPSADLARRLMVKSRRARRADASRRRGGGSRRSRGDAAGHRPQGEGARAEPALDGPDADRASTAGPSRSRVRWIECRGRGRAR